MLVQILLLLGSLESIHLPKEEQAASKKYRQLIDPKMDALVEAFHFYLPRVVDDFSLIITQLLANYSSAIAVYARIDQRL